MKHPRVFLVALCMVVPVAATAADMPDVTLQGVASGVALHIGYQGHGTHVLPETVYLKQGLMRLELKAPGEDGYVLRSEQATWLVNEKAQLALPMGKAGNMQRYIYDPARPCGDFPGTCEKGETKRIAGRASTGWKFRHAGTGGPDGADNGTFWIDDELGLMLGYDARDMEGRALGWTVTSVSFTPLPETLFQLPKTHASTANQGHP
jgi:hypothetical protein